MSSYDPEIDPTIREEIEEAERIATEEREREQRREELRRELRALLDEQRAAEERERPTRRARFSAPQASTPQAEPENEEPESEPASTRRSRGRSAGKTAKGIISGSILSSPTIRKSYPYLICGGLLVIFYLMSWFSVQALFHTRGVLERRLRDARTEAVNMSGEAKSVSSRSAVSRRIKEMGLELKESTKPVKVIEQ